MHKHMVNVGEKYQKFEVSLTRMRRGKIFLMKFSHGIIIIFSVNNTNCMYSMSYQSINIIEF